jgi:flagellar basal body P-ring formation protein FlgA
MNLPSYLKSYLKNFSSKQLRLPKLTGFLLLGLGYGLQAEANSQNLAVLRQEAETYLLNHYQSADNERLEIKLGLFDRRLNLAACRQAVAFRLQDSAGIGGKVTISCECNDSPGWTFHLPAEVEIYRPVLVASAQILRGDSLDQSDLKFETRNISQISGEVLTTRDVIGKAAKRQINAGDVIRSALLDQPKTINRGETVSITAKSGSIKVVMQGTAMTDGKLGQQIKVRNNQSDRIISAKVVGQAAVEIL